MALQALLATLGDEIEDAEEEAFLLFSQDIPSQNLGFVDSRAQTIDLAIGDRDFTIHQSPSLLSSNRSAGTTGAVLWKITPLIASWLSSPKNILREHSTLTESSTILELGCGISGLNGLSLSPSIGHYIATDQDYVLKILRQNIEENTPTNNKTNKNAISNKKAKHQGGSHHKSATTTSTVTSSSSSTNDHHSNIHLLPLDWELSSITDTLPQTLASLTNSPNPATALSTLDIVLACDCIYNTHLIPPFVQTCADICQLRQTHQQQSQPGQQTTAVDHHQPKTLCIIAQQLRSPDIFEAWLAETMQRFQVWRVPEEMVFGREGNDGGVAMEGKGFVVHFAVLKEEEKY